MNLCGFAMVPLSTVPPPPSPQNNKIPASGVRSRSAPPPSQAGSLFPQRGAGPGAVASASSVVIQQSCRAQGGQQAFRHESREAGAGAWEGLQSQADEPHLPPPKDSQLPGRPNSTLAREIETTGPVLADGHDGVFLLPVRNFLQVLIGQKVCVCMW